MPEGTFRLFVAVPVPSAALEACRRLIDGVRADPAGSAARWVRTENLHLTLRFLGATHPDRVPAIAGVMAAASRGTGPFEVELAGAGAFPEERRPRALWIGIARGADTLAALADALDDGLAPLGLPPDGRRFRPHLTVARTDAAGSAASAAAAVALRAAAEDWRTAFLADRVVLYRSHLGGGPPRYEPLEAIALSG